MKQILQSLTDGIVELAEVPAPGSAAGHLLIHSAVSLISAGTERMLLDFGKANWIDKARQQPDKVKLVLEKVSTDGLVATLDAVQSKLDQPLAIGYCNVGVVVDVGRGATGFEIGERVVSNGKHAEVVSAPRNLCARIPDSVSNEQASFTVLAAIGLQGIRLAEPTLGECVVVTGLGLIGLLTVQMLRSQGCRVLGIDPDPRRRALARQFGAEIFDPVEGRNLLATAYAFSRGRGVDAVIITASTKSNEPVAQAAKMCRRRGRIVLVGVVGLHLARADFYEKEISFQVSCSYGPGRYDRSYEEGGVDYPAGFVRWTVQRNFEAVLDLLASRTLDVLPLISHRFVLEEAVEAFDLLSSGSQSLGIVLEYEPTTPQEHGRLERRSVPLTPIPMSAGGVRVTFLGAGNYGGRVLIPAFKKAGASLHSVVSNGGVTAVYHGRKHGISQASTDSTEMLADSAVDVVVVATRHNCHARQVLAALIAGKHVFCEKPLCLTLDDLALIEAEVAQRPSQQLMIGFNRRFAPHVVEIRNLLKGEVEPKSIIMTVNAGAVPGDHWTQDKEVGGGRIVGEGCHFVDLLRHIIGSPIVRHQAVALGRHPSLALSADKVVITLEFLDGSVGTIHYLANGHKGFAKERLEIFCGGKVLQLDNFRKLRGWGWKPSVRMNRWSQDKGAQRCVSAFIRSLQNGEGCPIQISEVLEVSKVSIELEESLS